MRDVSVALMYPLPQGPRTLVLMLGWRCNASCVHCCWTALKRERPLRRAGWQQELSVSSVDGILNAYGEGLDNVTLCGFGEPMLHSEFSRVASVVAARAGGLSMTTNGSLLHKYPGIVDSSGFLVVSLDSPDARTFEGMRRGLRFSTVLGNMRLVASRARHPKRVLIVNMAVIRRNAAQIYDMARLLSEEGFHQLSLLRGVALDALGVVQPSEPYRELLRPDDPGVLKQMARARADFPQLVVNDFFTSLDGPCKTPPGQCCSLPWASMEITPDGVAHPCCRSYAVDLGYYASDPWHGAKMNRLREQLATFAVDPQEFPACAVCTLRGVR